MVSIETIPVERDLLGESPVWDPRIGALYWSDQLTPRVRRYTPSTGACAEWRVPKELGFVALTTDADTLMVALADGVYRLDLRRSECTLFSSIPQPRPGVRLNDGRCDRNGRIMTGSVTTDGGDAAGVVYHVGSDGRAVALRDGLVIVNAICCSPSGRQVYYADSRGGVIFSRSVSEAGAFGDETVFADVRPHGGVPDGATVDSEGGVWVAQIMRGHVLRFAPDGTLDRDIEMPCPHVSSLAFGGPDLDVLFVTSVRETGMLISSSHPEAGKLFAVTGLGVRGLEEPRFDFGMPEPNGSDEELKK